MDSLRPLYFSLLCISSLSEGFQPLRERGRLGDDWRRNKGVFSLASSCHYKVSRTGGGIINMLLKNYIAPSFILIIAPFCSNAYARNCRIPENVIFATFWKKRRLGWFWSCLAWARESQEWGSGSQSLGLSLTFRCSDNEKRQVCHVFTFLRLLFTYSSLQHFPSRTRQYETFSIFPNIEHWMQATAKNCIPQ